MPIRSRNITDDNAQNEFAQQIVPIAISLGASFNALAGEVIMPWAGKIISCKFRCTALTDADDSARVKPQIDGSDIVAAAVDPVAAGTTTTFTLTTSVFAAGERLGGHVLTGAGDAINGTFVFQVRPYLGAKERVANPPNLGGF